MKKTKSHSSQIVFNKPRAKDVLGSLNRAYKEQKQLFAHVTREENAPQQKFFPYGVERGDVEHRRWLFFATMTDRREMSNVVYESHARLWEREPRLYFEEVLGMSSPEILKTLTREKVGVPRQSAEYWQRSARTLFESFEGDPLTIYQKLESVNGILRFSKGGRGNQKGLLPGFGPKILSLLALFYGELKLMQIPGDAFPVDVHVQRFAISTGIVTAETPTVRSYEIERVLRPFLCNMCMEEGWKPLDLSHALWFLGNKCCSGCCRNAVAKLLCPSYEMCGGAVSTHSYFRQGRWDLTSPRYRRGGDCSFSLPPSPMFP
ncbi:MAG TPA: hypothetical protein ENI56_00015 [Candidatus Kaiserbacteria bacterium]|nr:hypothetical protein [Candidatus Kaiserbacteria bacterium]